MKKSNDSNLFEVNTASDCLTPKSMLLITSIKPVCIQLSLY